MLTYKDIMYRVHYLYDRSTLIKQQTLNTNLKWEISEDVFETIKKNMFVTIDKELLRTGNTMLGKPVEIIPNKTEHIKLFVEVE